MRTLYASLVLLAACSSAPLGSRTEAIVGGTKDPGDPAVVTLIGTKGNSPDASLCTAEVISPHVVLTAAHCVSPQVVGSGLSFMIFLGTDLNDQAQLGPSNFIDVAKTAFNPQFDVNNLQGGNDIAVAVTAKPIPVVPALVNQDPITAGDVGTSLRLVGYGITSTTAQTDTSGVKRQVSTALQYVDDLFLGFGDSTHNTCEGDSGGPAFMTRNGKEVIVGITSFGDQNCRQGGVDTRVDMFWTDFVAPQIMAADGTLPGNPSDPTPPDMAQPAGVTPGQVATSRPLGDACDDSTQCASGLCTVGGDRFCTAACDPQQANACPDGMHCGDVHGASYCLMASHGCSATTRPAPVGAGVVFLALLIGAFLHRRRAGSPA